MTPKEFVKIRKDCPWRYSGIDGKNPAFFCQATCDRCVTDKCALAYWKEFIVSRIHTI
jgi:hypothetical protein